MLNDNLRVVKSQIKPHFAGYSLIDYLVEKFPYNDREGWLLIIANKQIHLNGEVAGSTDTIKSDDILEYFHQNHSEPEVDSDFRIIFESDNYLVIDKPGNLPVHPAGKFFHNTLWSILKKDGYKPHFINRLDRETSGLILVALNKDTASALGKQIQEKKVFKKYLALVEGEFPESIDAKGYLEKDWGSEIEKKLIFKADPDFEKHGKNGVHSFFEKKQCKNGLSLLECVIETGRMHQIRATLKSLGFPLAGDKIYGVDESFYLKFIHKKMTEEDWGILRMKRQALHAHTLRFLDPVSRKEVEYVSKMPQDMCEVFDLI